MPPVRQIWHLSHLDNLNCHSVGLPASSLTSFLCTHVCTAARVTSKIKQCQECRVIQEGIA